MLKNYVKNILKLILKLNFKIQILTYGLIRTDGDRLSHTLWF